MQRFFAQPLLHFFAIGAALFLLFAFVGDSGEADPEEIRIDAQRIADLSLRFEQTWKRPPTPGELDGLIDSWIRDEVLYREGLALGLDRDDPVVRRRLAQKIDFMLDASVPLPTDEELQTWLAEHPERYRAPPQYAFAQAFFGTEEGLEAASRRAQEALATDDPAALGDPSLLPASLPLTSVDQITGLFGAAFGEDLAALPLQQWAGPVPSSYGLHLVRIEARQASAEPTLEEARRAVERDLMQERSEKMKQAALEALFERYEVTFDSDVQADS